jgi:hypothetical protein
MARGPDVLIKIEQDGDTVYLFCTSYRRFASKKLTAAGKADLEAALGAGTRATNGVYLNPDPPPGPTLLGGGKATSLDWETYAARVQVGP